jgi:hypothetical protein
MLWPTVSRPVWLWMKHPSGAYDQIFTTVRQLRVFLMRGGLSYERTGLSFTITAGPRQRSHSRVRVPWDSRSYFTLSDSRLPFSSPPTTHTATVEVFDPASTRDTDSLSKLCYGRGPVSRSVCLGTKHPSGVCNQIFITVWQLRSCSFVGPRI